MYAVTAHGKQQQEISPPGTRKRCEEWLRDRKALLMEDKGATWAIHYYPAAVLSKAEGERLLDEEAERLDRFDAIPDDGSETHELPDELPELPELPDGGDE